MKLVSLLLLVFTTGVFAQMDEIHYGDQRVDVLYGEGLGMSDRQQTYRWLQTVTNALRTVYGELPLNAFTINIQKSAGAADPVPWGQVKRDPTNVLLVINPALGFDEIQDDWTAFHELSHLLIPYQGYGDLWFSEGLATYYQNIIRARSQVISEADMWSELISGFERGQAQSQWSHLTLSDLSDNSRHYPAYMRIHWSGVHYWLSADIKLRQHGLSLDMLLQKLKVCCWGQSLTALEISTKLDKLAGLDIFVPLFHQYRDSKTMPEYQLLLSRLGLVRNLDSHDIVFKSDAPLVQTRRRIYHGNL